MRQGVKIPSSVPGILFRLVSFSSLQGFESVVDRGVLVLFREAANQLILWVKMSLTLQVKTANWKYPSGD